MKASTCYHLNSKKNKSKQINIYKNPRLLEKKELKKRQAFFKPKNYLSNFS